MEKYLYEDLYQLEEKHWWHINKRRAALSIIKKFTALNHPKILDLGCGTGKNLEYFNQVGTTYGLDPSQEAINFCKKRGLKNLKKGTSYLTGYPTSSFDLVMMLDVLEHTDEELSLKEVKRITKKHGYLLITVPAFSWLWSKWDEVLHHKKRYNKSDLEKVLKKNGFKIVKSSYMYSYLLLPVLIIRIIKSRLSKKQYASDFKISSPFINYLMLFISYLELKYMLNKDIPFGTSLICLAKKKS